MDEHDNLKWVQEPNCTTCSHTQPFYIDNGKRIDRLFCTQNEFPVNARVCCEEYELRNEEEKL